VQGYGGVVVRNSVRYARDKRETQARLDSVAHRGVRFACQSAASVRTAGRQVGEIILQDGQFWS